MASTRTYPLFKSHYDRDVFFFSAGEWLALASDRRSSVASRSHHSRYYEWRIKIINKRTLKRRIQRPYFPMTTPGTTTVPCRFVLFQQPLQSDLFISTLGDRMPFRLSDSFPFVFGSRSSLNCWLFTLWEIGKVHRHPVRWCPSQFGKSWQFVRGRNY